MSTTHVDLVQPPRVALVVEDSRAMRRVLRSALAAAGWSVVEAGDGAQALDLLDDGLRPDVVLVDRHLPVLDGLGVVRAVRSVEALRGLPVLMVTSESETWQVVRALAEGADEYLLKPFTADGLHSKLALLGLGPVTAP